MREFVVVKNGLEESLICATGVKVAGKTSEHSTAQ